MVSSIQYRFVLESAKLDEFISYFWGCDIFEFLIIVPNFARDVPLWTQVNCEFSKAAQFLGNFRFLSRMPSKKYIQFDVRKKNSQDFCVNFLESLLGLLLSLVFSSSLLCVLFVDFFWRYLVFPVKTNKMLNAIFFCSLVVRKLNDCTCSTTQQLCLAQRQQRIKDRKSIVVKATVGRGLSRGWNF